MTKKKTLKRIIVLIVIVALIISVAAGLRSCKKTVGTNGEYTLYTVGRRNISTELTGTATVQPKDTYTINSSVDADVLYDFFEENDTVEKDAVLYELDSSSSSSLERNVERAQKSYDTAIENLQNLDVKSTISGRVTKLYVEIGDEIKAGTPIADIVNDAYMYLEVPFSTYDVQNFSVGTQATVITEANFETLPATVNKISSNVTTMTGGIKVQNVTLKVANSGSLLPDSTASAKVGEISCIENGIFKYGTGMSKTINAKVSGEVVKIVADEGENVTSNGIIVSMQNDDLEDALDDAISELETANDQKDKYTVKAPISGTVVQKNYKAGETITAGQTLAIIYDMSYLKLDLAVDELDIQSIKVGQQVSITADTVDKPLTGYISATSIVGSTSSNSTTYPVTIIIEEPGDLLPGMNVEASIIISQSQNCLAIPTDAITRGNVVKVLKSDKKENLTEDDFEKTKVVTGNTDTNFVEIISGLEEGDVIGIYKAAIVQTTTDSNMFGGMSGGMPSGNMSSSRPSGNMDGNTGNRMPSGNMGGGMPQGNRGGM